MPNHPLFLISWNAIISADKSVTASDRASIVESPAVGKNSQFHVIISIFSLISILGIFQLSSILLYFFETNSPSDIICDFQSIDWYTSVFAFSEISNIQSYILWSNLKSFINNVCVAWPVTADSYPVNNFSLLSYFIIKWPKLVPPP